MNTPAFGLAAAREISRSGKSFRFGRIFKSIQGQYESNASSVRHRPPMKVAVVLNGV